MASKNGRAIADFLVALGLITAIAGVLLESLVPPGAVVVTAVAVLGGRSIMRRRLPGGRPGEGAPTGPARSG